MLTARAFQLSRYGILHPVPAWVPLNLKQLPRRCHHSVVLRNLHVTSVSLHSFYPYELFNFCVLIPPWAEYHLKDWNKETAHGWVALKSPRYMLYGWAKAWNQKRYAISFSAFRSSFWRSKFCSSYDKWFLYRDEMYCINGMSCILIVGSVAIASKRM